MMEVHQGLLTEGTILKRLPRQEIEPLGGLVMGPVSNL